MADQGDGWLNPPPVIVVSGSEGFYTRRQLQKAILAAGHTGRRVDYVDGADKDVVASAIGDMFCSTPVLVVVSHPEKLDPDLVADHQASKSKWVSMLLYYEGDITKTSDMGKVVEGIPKKHVLRFPKPEWFKQKETAVRFVVQEGQRRGKKISERLADALVSRVGEDLGTLSFEVLKLDTYLDALGEETAKPEHVRKTMLRTGEAKIGPIVDALGKQSVPLLLKTLDQYRVNQGGEPDGRTLAVCAWVTSQVLHWLHAATLDAMGAEVAEAASRMDVKPYRYERFILPVARAWGVSRLIALVKSLSSVERGAKSSHIDSWLELEIALVKACRAEGESG